MLHNTVTFGQIPPDYLPLADILAQYPDIYPNGSGWRYLVMTGELPSVYVARGQRGLWFVDPHAAHAIAARRRARIGAPASQR